MSGKKGGKAAVRAAVEGAQPAPANPAEAPAVRTEAPSYLASRFDMRPEGLFKKRDDNTTMWLSAPFAIEAETRDDSGRGWGLLLSWHDRDGAPHEEAFGRQLFTGECGEVRARLADGGLSLNAAQPARQAFGEYLSVAASGKRARSVRKIGWHDAGGRPVFVLPGATIGQAPERIVLQLPGEQRSLFNESGTLDEWRSEIGRRCIGNSRFAFAASCGFAAPLLSIIGEEGGGFHLCGKSRSGKTTALRVAASVCGGTAATGASGFVWPWRATDNGLEGISALHNDCLLPLDELGQADGRVVGDAAYMLSNGQGKGRSERSGGMVRPSVLFRVLFLSTGEIGLAEKMAESNKIARAGMEVRCCEIPAPANAEFGFVEDSHGEADSGRFVHEMNQLVRRYHGTPLRAFLARLVGELQRAPTTYVDRLRERVAELARQFLEPRPSAGGQVRSAAGRFAVVALGGELASEWLLTEWPGGEATAAAASCFQAWLAGRGTAGAQEDAQAATQLRAFIARHGGARFDDWKDPEPTPDAQQTPPSNSGPPTERFRTGNRAGWRRWIRLDDGGGYWRYYLTGEAMKEALAGLAINEAKRTLVAQGLLVPSPRPSDLANGVVAGLHTVPNANKVRLYQVADDVLRGGDEVGAAD